MKEAPSCARSPRSVFIPLSQHTASLPGPWRVRGGSGEGTSRWSRGEVVRGEQDQGLSTQWSCLKCPASAWGPGREGLVKPQSRSQHSRGPLGSTESTVRKGLGSRGVGAGKAGEDVRRVVVPLQWGGRKVTCRVQVAVCRWQTERWAGHCKALCLSVGVSYVTDVQSSGSSGNVVSSSELRNYQWQSSV